MSFQTDYDNAERTMFLDKAGILPNGKPFYRPHLGMCLVEIGGVTYYETMYLPDGAINSVEANITSFKPNRYVALQVIDDLNTPKNYNGEQVTPVFSFNMWA